MPYAHHVFMLTFALLHRLVQATPAMRVQVQIGCSSPVDVEFEGGIENLKTAAEGALGFMQSTLTLKTESGARLSDISDVTEGCIITAVTAEADTWYVKIVDAQDGSELTFKVRPKTRMTKVLESYMQRRGISNPNSLRFTHDGERITRESAGEQTLLQLGIEDGDQLDAFVEAIGGRGL